jgi:hypothetical protein
MPRAPGSLALLFLLAACTAAPPAPVVGSGGAAGAARSVNRDGDFAPRIDGPDVWSALSIRPATSSLAGTEVVKVVLDRTDGSFYFLQSERWPIHYFFARRFLSTLANPVGDEAIFNRREYHSPDRRFILGALSHYPGDIWAFELYAGDDLDLETTARTFAAIKKAVFFGDRLRYRPVPLAHENDPRTRALLPVVETGEIFGNIRYQALELGESYGFLRIVRDKEPFDPGKIRPFDILVLARQPEDIPVVSGVITDELQAPLGHINVLCHNRRTPNMALRGASTSPEITALEGKLVRLSIEGQKYQITPASQQDAERSWEARRPVAPPAPRRDDSDIGLPSLADLSLADLPRVGAKTAQLGQVTRAARGQFRVPKGFALPMHAYARFLEKNGFDRRIKALLDDPTFQKDPDVRRKALEELRAAMLAGEVPDEILTPLLARITALLPPGKVRLRSSTNAEDLAGFNGAGLYRSTRVDPTKREDVIRGLREVWASVWLPAAHEERAWYRIDSRAVGMAILVQESVDDDVFNGVAITANPFSQGQPGFFINAQSSGGSVTGAHGNEVPEQLLVYTYEDGKGVERLSFSSRSNNKPLLTPADIIHLTAALKVVHLDFTHDDYGMSGNAVDVEFLLAGASHEVVIVQARPFTVSWPQDRRWLDDTGRPLVPAPR